jgi:sulfide dehydrogenase [flavocytochrome c] flavoprotein subunit
MRTSRRAFNAYLGAVGAAALTGRNSRDPRAQERGARARVLIVGGGFGGATCAKYLRRANPELEVTLVEQDSRYVSCPLSNAVVAGLLPLSELTVDYERLQSAHGVSLVHARAADIDPASATVRLAGGQRLAYDRLVVAPGTDVRFDAIEGYDERVIEIMPHAWKAGPQTEQLRRQLEAMDDGGTVIVTVPPMPYRCPPGPYERASLIAYDLKRTKPRSKVLILDANEEFPKQALFEDGWASLYGDMIDRISGDAGRVTAVDVGTRTVVTADGSKHRAEVVNLIPPEKAGAIAETAGLTDASGWCPADPRTLISRRQDSIHVIGDASSAGLPKSAALANSEAKVCAAAIGALLRGDPIGDPAFVNACYSLVAPDYAISIAMMYETAGDEVRIIDGATGTSPREAPMDYRAKEAEDARGWFDSIIADSFA